MPRLYLAALTALLCLYACGDKADEDDDDDGGATTISACEDYIDAYNTCIEELVEGDTGFQLDQSVCLEVEEGMEEFQCFAEVYRAGDCSSFEGLEAMAPELQACQN